MTVCLIAGLVLLMLMTSATAAGCSPRRRATG